MPARVAVRSWTLLSAAVLRAAVFEGYPQALPVLERAFDNGVMEGLGRLSAAVTDCLDTPVWALPDQALLDALDGVQAARVRLAAVEAQLVREVDGRALPAAQHATSTAGWLRERLRISAHTAKRIV